MSDKVRLASVGLGRWARVLANGARRGDVIELVSCFSRNEDKRREFQEEYGIPRAASSYEELLKDPEVEGILVATPNDTHKDLMIQALEAGKAVYTDKPIAHTVEDGLAILQAQEETGLPVAVGHSARRLSASRIMKEWIESGKLGDVSIAESNFSNERGLQLSTETWRYYADKSPGGSMIQLGVHHADNLQYLLGRVKSVSAHARRLFTKAEVPDAAIATLEFESGALATIVAGWASPAIYTINLQGTKHNLRLDVDFSEWHKGYTVDENSTLLAQEYGSSERTEVKLGQTDMYREQLEEFALAIRGKAEVEVGPREAIDALAVVHATLLSSERNGEAVELAELTSAAQPRV